VKRPTKFSPTVGTGKKFIKVRLYDTMEWVEYRNLFLRENPKCYCCGQRSVVVDHVIAFKGDKKLFWNPTNYIPLCKSEHDTITALFDRYNPPKTEQKMIWIAARRLITGTLTSVRFVATSKC
jgi:hypothetical protein